MNTIEFSVACRILAQKYQRAHLTQTQLAKELGIPQSQISRVLNGKTKRPNNTYFKLCNYLNKKIENVKSRDAPIPTEILQAVEEVWDGSLDHARALAAVIRSLAVLKLQCPSEKRGGVT